MPGICTFELLYRQSVNGPLHILRQLWTKEQSNPEFAPHISTVLTFETDSRKHGTWLMTNSDASKCVSSAS